jgi:hypothetical protein
MPLGANKSCRSDAHNNITAGERLIVPEGQLMAKGIPKPQRCGRGFNAK